MYIYVYDDYLNKSRFNKAINRMEIRLTDLALNGKIIRLAGIKNTKVALQNEIKLGAKTIVAVGNNQTVNKIISAFVNADIYPEFKKNTLLGIIPIGPDNSIAESLGIFNEEEACNILLARRIQQIDLGLVGNNYFLNKAVVEGKNTVIKLNDYSLEPIEKSDITIINLLTNRKNQIQSNPNDGLLDVMITATKNDKTLLRLEKFQLESEHKVVLDDVLEVETPALVSVMKNKLNVIVGKERSF